MRKMEYNPRPRARSARVALALAAALCVLGAQSSWGLVKEPVAWAASVEKQTKPGLPVWTGSDIFSGALKMEFNDATWVKAIRSVRVEDQSLRAVTSSFSLTDNTYYARPDEGGRSSLTIKGWKDQAEIVVEAEGYAPLRLRITKKGSRYEVVEVEAPLETPDPAPQQEADVTLPAIQKKSHEYYLSFPEQPKKMDTVQGVKVRDQEWKRVNHSSPGSGEYTVNRNGELVLGAARWSSSAPAEIRSGDVVELQFPEGAPLRFQIVIAKGEVRVEPVSEAGDGQQLHVALVGAFDAAMVGQKNYDSVSGATGSVTSNRNSDVEVHGLLAPKEQEVTPEQIKGLLSEAGDRVDTSKTQVLIAPEGSGMQGVYHEDTSRVTLRGVPAKAGQYDVRIRVTDVQGRVAESNALPLTIFAPGEATLKDRLTPTRFGEADFKQQADGKYIYTMNPWYIARLDDAQGDLSVPKEVKAWYGSHRSGTYGVLGESVPSGTEAKQILRVPEGADLTLVNMDILSGVKIVVEKGARLSLQDAVVQGVVEVQDGGTFRMNYNEKGFQSGASINGQLVLKDGATLEDSSIYSNTNFIANGKEARHNTEPVVLVEGNVTVKGKVFIRGDEAPTGEDPKTKQSYSGQPGLAVRQGTLWLSDGARLAVYGGGHKATTAVGGDAIQLEQATIQGPGTLIALGGQGTWNRGGDGVSGQGTVDVANAYLQGGAAIAPKEGVRAGLGKTDGIEVSEQTRWKQVDGAVVRSGQPAEEAPRWIGVTVPSEEAMETQFSLEGTPEKAPWKKPASPEAGAPSKKIPALPVYTSSNFLSGGLQMEFEDAAWIKGIQKVSVGGKEFAKAEGAFSMGDDTYYARPDEGGRSGLTLKGWKEGDEILIESDGYAPLRLQVTKQGNKYQVVRVEEPAKPEEPVQPAPAEPEKPIVSEQPPVSEETSTPEHSSEPEKQPEEPVQPTPAEGNVKVPALPVKTTSNLFAGGLQMEFEDAAWVKGIQKVSVGGKEFAKAEGAFSMGDDTYYARPDEGGRSGLTLKGWKEGDEILIESDGYAPLRLQVTKQGNKYQVVRVEEPAKPEEPVQPAPAEPEKPIVSEQPPVSEETSTPEHSSEPEKPIVSEQPPVSEETSTPEHSSEPEKHPEEPVQPAPAEPEKPIVPEQPPVSEETSTPESSSEPEKPSEEPVQPTPAEPEKPIVSEQPPVSEETSTPENSSEPEKQPEEPVQPAPAEGNVKVPALPVKTTSNLFAGGLQMEFDDAAWVKGIQKVSVGGKEFAKAEGAFSMGDDTYYARPDEGGRSGLTLKGWKEGDEILIESDGYAPLRLQVTKQGSKYQVVRVEEPAKPEEPVQPTPAEPEKPIVSEQPPVSEETSTPESSSEPAKPEEPVQPTPAEPEKPIVSEQPPVSGETSTPEHSSEPEKPSDETKRLTASAPTTSSNVVTEKVVEKTKTESKEGKKSPRTGDVGVLSWAMTALAAGAGWVGVRRKKSVSSKTKKEL